MAEPVTFTLSEGTWFLLGVFALLGAIICALEAYWLVIETAYNIRRYLTRRRHD